MCYAFKTVRDQDGSLHKIQHRDFVKLLQNHKIIEKEDGFYYARDQVPLMIQAESGLKISLMRWDLIPSFYLAQEKLSYAEVQKKKVSKSINPFTKKSYGFSSYNARIETVQNLPTFRKPLMLGQRGIIPVIAFKEYPNSDEAPSDKKNQAYTLELDQVFYFACLYDIWYDKNNTAYFSCANITLSSSGNRVLEKIWHERVPALLNEDQALCWIDPKTPANIALKQCQALSDQHMSALPDAAKHKKSI